MENYKSIEVEGDYDNVDIASTLSVILTSLDSGVIRTR